MNSSLISYLSLSYKRVSELFIIKPRIYTIFIVLVFQFLERDKNRFSSPVKTYIDKDVSKVYNILSRQRIFLKNTMFAGLDS